MSVFHKTKHGIAGFTLIELMVAVFIFAIIISIVGPTLSQFLEVRERVTTKQDQLEKLQKTFLFMANDLRYASNRLGKDEFGEAGDSTLSVGDDSLIDLTAAYPSLSLGGLNVPRRVRWILEDNTLLRLQSPVMDPDGDTRVFRQELLRNVRDVEIELSIIEDGRDSTSKRWDEETRLPDKVEIVVKLENKTEYRRVFTMLGGDNLAAVAASLNADTNAASSQSSSNGTVNDRQGRNSDEGDNGRLITPPGFEEESN